LAAGAVYIRGGSLFICMCSVNTVRENVTFFTTETKLEFYWEWKHVACCFNFVLAMKREVNIASCFLLSKHHSVYSQATLMVTACRY